MMPSCPAGRAGWSICRARGCSPSVRQRRIDTCGSRCEATRSGTRCGTGCRGTRSASASTRGCIVSRTLTIATSGRIFKTVCRRPQLGRRCRREGTAEMAMRFDDLRVAGIFFWGRSGSVFLHSLFDSHPEVLTLPASRLNAFHAREWPKIAREPDVRSMARRFVALNPSVFDGRKDRWFEGLGAMGPGRDTPLVVNADAFVAELERLLGEPLPV